MNASQRSATWAPGHCSLTRSVFATALMVPGLCAGQVHTHDAADRLTSSSVTNVYAEHYVYDAAGNLTQKVRTGSGGPLQGLSVGVEVNYPSLGTWVPRAAPPRALVKVVAGAELTGWLSVPSMSMDIGDGSLTVADFADYPGYPAEAAFSPAAFNGPVLRLPVNGRWAFASAEWTSPVDLGGTLLPPVVEPHRLAVNWASNTYRATSKAIAGFKLTPITPTSTFQVPANQESGALFEFQGSRCIVHSSGNWRADSAGSPVGPEGGGPANETFAMPAAPAFSLVAREEVSGHMHFIGSDATLDLPTGTALSFLMNDAAGAYADNAGSLQVEWSCNP